MFFNRSHRYFQKPRKSNKNTKFSQIKAKQYAKTMRSIYNSSLLINAQINIFQLLTPFESDLGTRTGLSTKWIFIRAGLLNFSLTKLHTTFVDRA